MTREGLINYGEMFLEVNNDSKNSNTYEFIEEALKLFKQESVLDKIKSEVESIDRYATNNGHDIWLRTPEEIKEEVFNIIDKYKVRSENKE